MSCPRFCRRPFSKRCFAVVLIGGLWLGALSVVVGQAPPMARPQPGVRGPLGAIRLPGYLMPRAPDLSVAISGPTRAVPGEDITVTITVSNKGTAPARGTQEAGPTQAYMVDVVLSKDAAFPLAWAIQPVYAGLTQEDFVEDMLMLGGRVSNTQTLAPGAQAVYRLTTHIPRRTEPGVYYLGAVVDAGDNVAELREDNNVGYYPLRIGAAQGPRVQPPPGTGLWVMPYAVGDTLIPTISPQGYTNYVDTASGLQMVNAPFGGRLGFRLGYHEALPNETIAYYRWSYRRAGAGGWEEFMEPVGVHYMKTQGGVTSFPVLSLGPQTVAGMHLYAFKPHAPPTIPGATTAWPPSDWFGDIYSGFLETRSLADGAYQIRLELFGPSGNKIMPAADGVRFLLPARATADGTLATVPAPLAPDGSFIFTLQIDNRACVANVEAPTVGTIAAGDECGFLLYDPRVPANDPAALVNIAFQATHPASHGRFQFTIYRGIRVASEASGEIAAASAGVYRGDGSGSFQHSFPRTELLGPRCPEKAAFSANLYVYAKATTGWHYRLSGLDASFVRAFALAPR